MSIVDQTVIMYGFRVDFGSLSENLRDMYRFRTSSVGEPIIISDGRGVDYEFIGQLIAKTN